MKAVKIGPVAHGVLLGAALLLAYQTWTREDEVERKIGNVKVWSESPDALTAIVYETKNRTVRVEPRGDGKDRYLWGVDTRVITKPPVKQPEEPEGGPVLPEPEPEKETRVTEFALGEKGQSLVQDLSRLRALIALGELDDAKKKEYGLVESTDNVIVSFSNKTHSLLLGSKVYGGSDRYAIEVESGKAYVLSGEVLTALLSVDPLKLRDPHAFKDDEVGKVRLSVNDKIRSLVKIKRTDEQGKETVTWADAATPDKPDQTMDNFLKNVGRLQPSAFDPDRQADTLELLVKVEYQRADGGALGWLELYKEKEAPEEPAPEGAAPGAGEPKPGDDKPAGEPKPGDAKPGDAKPGAAEAKPADPKAGGAAAGETKPGDAKPGETAAGGAEKPAEAEKPAAKPKAPPKFFIRSELTRVFAETSAGTATRIAEDLGQLFTE